MSPYSILDIRVDVYIRHIDLGLVIIDIVDLCLIIHYPVLVYLYESLGSLHAVVTQHLLSSLLNELSAPFANKL